MPGNRRTRRIVRQADGAGEQRLSGDRAMASTLASFTFAAAAIAVLASCSPTPATKGAGPQSASSSSLEHESVTPGTERDLQANVGDRVFFAKESSELGPEGLKVLERQAQWLERYPNVTVTIEGHCDERGTREYNLALGNRRAYEVKELLVAQGIAPQRIATISYGKESPAVPGSGEVAWAQNRRAVTVVNSAGMQISAVAH